MSACNNTDSNEFAFSNYSWECPKEGGRKIFTSNKDVQSPNQKIPDRKTKCDFWCKIKACLIEFKQALNLINDHVNR